jgi:hypothetical protein
VVLPEEGEKVMELIFGCQHYFIRIARYQIYGQMFDAIEIFKGDIEIGKKAVEDPSNPELTKQMKEMGLHVIPLNHESISGIYKVISHMMMNSLKSKKEVIFLTRKKHDNYIHQCGISGMELELEGMKKKCEQCEIRELCESSHSIIDEKVK